MITGGGPHCCRVDRDGVRYQISLERGTAGVATNLTVRQRYRPTRRKSISASVVVLTRRFSDNHRLMKLVGVSWLWLQAEAFAATGHVLRFGFYFFFFFGMLL